jgi:hypothetical protein
MKIIDTKNMEETIAKLKREEEAQGQACLNTQQRIQLDPWYCEKRIGR